ncbi:MAG: hypothetical protein L3K06_07210 [Thermoplasmata archaeon]|nr:hypothetical protein [Thermoplasmata archaeon]
MSHFYYEEIAGQRYADFLRNERQAELAALVKAEQDHTSLSARAHALVGRLPRLTRARRTHDVRGAYA